MYEIVKTSFPDATMILRDGIYWIPIDEENRDYVAYLEWVAEGNTAEEWTPEI
jgi:hypothetical protein